MNAFLHRFLDAFARWAISRNAPGAYDGENDQRWAYTIETDGSPYLTRVLFTNLLPVVKRVFGVGIYLHHFHRPDGDRVLHSHPWANARSFILLGSYDEERLDLESHAILTSEWYRKVKSDLDPEGKIVDRTPVDRRRVRWFNRITREDYHRVVQLHGHVWTLFITGRRLPDDDGGNWGFLVDGKHVPWKQFLGKSSKESP